MKAAQTPRRAGVMLPVSALPSRHGIGDLGEAAFRFIDMLAESRVRLWQILPLNPLGYGNSPYQPYSSFAGDPLYISLDDLYAQGLLPAPPDPFDAGADSIDYEAVRAFKEGILHQAFKAFVPDADYGAFAAQAWVHNYAVFTAFKRANGMASWHAWPAAQKNWPQNRQAVDLSPFDEAIRFEMFLQFQFYRQWMRVKAHANAQDIKIVGDIPIYVGIDSLDVWAGRENFLLDAEGVPTFVAGVPPDYFSETGQRWGNPLYDWAHLARTGFAFWVERLRYSATLFDIVRIDHFRGFDTYWKIPAACPTAVEGEWMEAPGYALFDTVLAALPGIEIIAEDLGMLRDEVYQLRDHYHFRGMNIIQFTFDAKKPTRPSQDRPHMVAYTGTHDNQTTLGWWQSQPRAWRLRARLSLWRLGYRRGGIASRFVRFTLDNAADMAIIPAQDIMGLPDSARLNTPGTVGPPNWMWRLKSLDALSAHMPAFASAIARSGRSAAASAAQATKNPQRIS